MKKGSPLIQKLIHDGYLTSKEIVSAMSEIGREQFVNESVRGDVQKNIPLPVGIEEIHVMQPSTAAFVLELLKAKQGEKILVVGVGSGWIAALIAKIVAGKKEEKETGVVYAVEENEECFHSATKNLEQFSFISNGIAHVICGAWDAEYNDGAPYDAIISLRAISSIPVWWKDAIRVGGRIITPIDESIIVKEKRGASDFETKEYFGFNFPRFS